MVARVELDFACPTLKLLEEETFFESIGHSALEKAENLVERTNLAETLAGRFGLQYVLAQAAIVRPILRSPSRLLASSLILACGGEDYNPHGRIDRIGGWLAREIVRRRDFPICLHIEETGWEFFHPNGHDHWKVVIDPIDGTSGLINGNKEQATGIVIADGENKFLAGVVASLVDNELVLIEGGSAKILEFDDQTVELFKPQLPLREQRDINNARIATLGRRMNLLKNTELFEDRHCPDLLTFGGYGLLWLLRGQGDVLLDPFKGQPWYEAVLWGWMAQEGGLVVTNERGEPIDFSQILERTYQHSLSDQAEDLPRVKMVISSDQKLHNQVLGKLRPKVEEGIIEEVFYQLTA